MTYHTGPIFQRLLVARPWVEKMLLINQNHSSCYEHQFEPKISGIGSADLKLWGFKNRWFLTISENLQNSNFPHFAHFDTFWFFSHNFQTNQSILNLKVLKGDKILEQFTTDIHKWCSGQKAIFQEERKTENSLAFFLWHISKCLIGQNLILN